MAVPNITEHSYRVSHYNIQRCMFSVGFHEIGQTVNVQANVALLAMIMNLKLQTELHNYLHFNFFNVMFAIPADLH
jgi:hypothetical protein